MYSRRHFIKLAGAASTAALFACERAAESSLSHILPSPGVGFPRSMSDASRRELDISLHLLAGRLPDDISGHAFTIGSIPIENDGPQVVGDGMIYRLSFDNRGAFMKSRLVKTDCFLLDEATKDDP